MWLGVFWGENTTRMSNMLPDMSFGVEIRNFVFAFIFHPVGSIYPGANSRSPGRRANEMGRRRTGRDGQLLDIRSRDGQGKDSLVPAPDHDKGTCRRWRLLGEGTPEQISGARGLGHLVP